MKITEYWEPVIVELRRDDDNENRWFQKTREGDEIVGIDNGKTLTLSADTFKIGTIVSFQEPVTETIIKGR